MGDKGLATTDFKGLKFINRGKVRDIYAIDASLLIVATDRISAFDVIMPNSIPGKGKILTQISSFWFHEMEDIVENHLISTRVEDFPEECRPYEEELRDRSMLVKKAVPLPVECVVRGYLAGSGWKDYSDGRPVSGVVLPEGLLESSRFSEPIFTPSTKADEGDHDAPITRKEVENLIGQELTEKMVDICMRIYNRASKIAEKRGIIIADTKMEFGLEGDTLILIDELLTPDSSRFWPRDDFEEGRPQKSYDKQFLRDYLLSIEWDKTPPAPELPGDIIQKTKEKYEEALKLIVS